MASCDFCWAAIDHLSVGPTGRMYCSAECLNKDQMARALKSMVEASKVSAQAAAASAAAVAVAVSVSEPPASVLPPLQIRLNESIVPSAAERQTRPSTPPGPAAATPDYGAFPSALPGVQETHNAISSLSLDSVFQEIPKFPKFLDRASVSGWWKTFLSVARKFCLDAESRWEVLREFLPSNFLIQHDNGRKYQGERLESLRDRLDLYCLPRPQRISELRMAKMPSLATLFDHFRAQVALALPVGVAEEVVEAVARDALVSELSEISFMQRSVEVWRSLCFEERSVQKLLAIFGENYRKWRPDLSHSPHSSSPPQQLHMQHQLQMPHQSIKLEAALSSTGSRNFSSASRASYESDHKRRRVGGGYEPTVSDYHQRPREAGGSRSRGSAGSHMHFSGPPSRDPSKRE